MSLFDYQPGKIQISYGVPGLDLTQFGLAGFTAYLEMTDWVNLSPQKSNSRFNLSRGILGESFLEYNSDSSRIFNLSLFQTSSNVEALRVLFFLQTLGIGGMPFVVSDISSGGNITDEFLTGLDLSTRRQKSIYAQGWILDEPSEGWALDAQTWDYQIAVTYGQTIYI